MGGELTAVGDVRLLLKAAPAKALVLCEEKFSKGGHVYGDAVSLEVEGHLPGAYIHIGDVDPSQKCVRLAPCTACLTEVVELSILLQLCGVVVFLWELLRQKAVLTKEELMPAGLVLVLP